MSIIMSNILVKPLEDGSYSLTVAGYVLIGVIIFAALVLIARIGNELAFVREVQIKWLFFWHFRGIHQIK